MVEQRKCRARSDGVVVEGTEGRRLPDDDRGAHYLLGRGAIHVVLRDNDSSRELANTEIGLPTQGFKMVCWSI